MSPIRTVRCIRETLIKSNTVSRLALGVSSCSLAVSTSMLIFRCLPQKDFPALVIAFALGFPLAGVIIVALYDLLFD